jgi:hypothetical protein
VGELFESAERKRSVSQVDDAMETEAATDGWVCEWDAATLASEPTEKLCEWIAARLDEPQVRIVRAIVDILGPPIALEMLATTERVQANGGMVIEETGKSRTSGGIYVKLLRDATHLDADATAAALARIKAEGAEAKKEAQRKLNLKRRSNSHLNKQGDPAVSASSPPKVALGDFMVGALKAK